MLSPDYLDYVFDINKNKLTIKNSMVVKIIDNSCIYVSFELPLSTAIDYETTAKNYKSNIIDKYSLRYNGYFAFLKKRMDILQQYPQMYFEMIIKR
jgi:hypothetical protein